jgi:hypothetical protein
VNTGFLISADRLANLLLRADALLSADDVLRDSFGLFLVMSPDTVGTGLAFDTCGFFRYFVLGCEVISVCFFFRNLFPDVISGRFLAWEELV